MNFKNKIILAPMAGITDRVFRAVCKYHGAEIVVTEMVSAEALARGAANTMDLARFDERERPVGVQLFGSDPRRLGEAARLVQERFQPDFIDLNSGCPVRKVITRNGGAALLRDALTFEKIVSSMVRSTAIPITVKIRSGWDRTRLVDTTFARIARDCGAAAITIHPRTKADGFSGRAQWERIALVKNEVDIPVIGNGDIRSPDDARRMLRETGCDSVMIGRAALGNPWIFGQCRKLLDGGPVPGIPDSLRCATALDHLDALCRAYDNRRVPGKIRKHLAWYVKGLPGASVLRNAIFSTQDMETLKMLVREFFSGRLQDTG